MAKGRKRTKGLRDAIPAPWKPPTPEEEMNMAAERLIETAARAAAKKQGGVGKLTKMATKLVRRGGKAKAESD